MNINTLEQELALDSVLSDDDPSSGKPITGGCTCSTLGT